MDPVAKYKGVLLPPVNHPRGWRFVGLSFWAIGLLIMVLAFHKGSKVSCLAGLPTSLAVFFFGTYAMNRWSRHLVRQLRARLHQCTQCSYDLTGNTSGVCPECGTAIVPSPSGIESHRRAA